MSADEGPSTPEHAPTASAVETDMLDWILNVIYGVAFLLILIVFDLLQRISIFCGRSAHEFVVLGLNRSLAASLRLLGVKIHINDFQPLQRGQAYIIVSNHQSLFDIPILHSLFGSHRPRFIAKEELARWIPSVSFNLRHGGNALIDRSNAKQAIAEIERMGRLIAELRCAGVIFPEGTRAKEGMLKRFRYAGLASLLQTAPNATIVPVTIDGSWKLVPQKGSPIPRGQTVHITVGRFIPRNNHDSLKHLIGEIEGVVTENLKKLRNP